MRTAIRLTTRVKAPEEEHTISIAKVLAWLEGGGKSASEQVLKNRLRSEASLYRPLGHEPAVPRLETRTEWHRQTYQSGLFRLSHVALVSYSFWPQLMGKLKIRATLTV